MLQSESIKFLEDCIKQVEKAPPEEIEIMKKRYKENMKCDHYCHSCDWDFVLIENCLYNHKCKLGLNNTDNR